MKIPGLTYVPNYLTSFKCNQLITCIDRQTWSTELSRRVQHYGYVYDYRKRRIDPSMHLGPLPDWLKKVAKMLKRDVFFRRTPDQVIVNEYFPGQGIAPHIDCPPCFQNTIATISLGWPYEMEFVHTRTKQSKYLNLKVGSLLVLQDQARYVWTHSIARRNDDHGVPRKRRISITFRTVIL